jgi:hypothetical protein
VYGAHIAGERLGLFNTYIRFQHHMCQIIGNRTRALALETPVEGQADLVDRTTSDL